MERVLRSINKSIKTAIKPIKNRQMDGTEVKFPTCVSGFRVCRRVVRFMAPATTRAAETFLPYLVLNEFHKDYISEIHI